MDNKTIIKDLEDVSLVLKKYWANPIIGYGVALGFYRDNNFLPGDDDVDIVIIDKLSLEQRKAIGWTLFDLGFRPQQIAFNVFGRMEPGEIGYNGDGETGIIVCERNFKFTIFFMKEEECEMHGAEYVCIPKLGSVKLIATPKKFYNKFDSVKIGGKKYFVPSPIKEYLSFTYFNNWKDRDDRRHGHTYLEMHAKETIDIEGKNEVLITK